MRDALVRLARLSALAAAGVALAGPALAHHSFAMFDMGAEKSISGTVSDYQWTNPHTWIWVDVPTASGSEKWGVEGMSPNFLERRGWSKRTIAIGDKVTVVVHPVKDGGHGGSFISVTLPDGKVMNMMGSSAPTYGAPAGPPAPATAPTKPSR
jgi:hypothetical protein